MSTNKLIEPTPLWRADGGRILTTQGRVVASCRPLDGACVGFDAVDRARIVQLIAAAPSLLVALQMTYTRPDRCGYGAAANALNNMTRAYAHAAIDLAVVARPRA